MGFKFKLFVWCLQYDMTFDHMFKLSFPLLPVARIALVKPDKARGVEDLVLRAAQMGQITEKVGWRMWRF